MLQFKACTFLIKGLERAGQLNSATKESLSQIFHIFRQIHLNKND